MTLCPRNILKKNKKKNNKPQNPRKGSMPEKKNLDPGLKLVFAVGTTECLPEVPNQNLETPAMKFDFDVVLGLIN